jgi:hypothetical protein
VPSQAHNGRRAPARRIGTGRARGRVANVSRKSPTSCCEALADSRIRSTGRAAAFRSASSPVRTVSTSKPSARSTRSASAS